MVPDAAEALDDDVRDHVAPDPFAEGKDKRDGRVEMGSGNGREDRDEHDEDGAGRDGVAEKRDGLIAAGQAFRHDAGADHCRYEDRGPEPFGEKPSVRSGHLLLHSAAVPEVPRTSVVLPIASSCLCRAS
jgi:hypothetical protein